MELQKIFKSGYLNKLSDSISSDKYLCDEFEELYHEKTWWALIPSAIILLLKEILIKLVDRKPDWKPESIGDYIMQNIFELLEYVLSYASNTVSFLRVGAFVLVHAGMMMVVFNLAGDSKNVFVIILGNALVIALEGLLTGIQAMRLEFYEMFSRFYEGDGREFKGVLLKSKKKKIKVK